MSVGPRRRLALACNDVRYYGRHHRWIALGRSLFLTIACGHESELCDLCGNRYIRFLWWAPTPLWREVHGNDGGCMCPSCFERECRKRGVWTSWTPIVTGRRGEDGEYVFNSNHWLNATRDWLCMGQPSDIYTDDPPQLWTDVHDALVAYGYDVTTTLYADDRDHV
jgi:hypothetical protein